MVLGSVFHNFRKRSFSKKCNFGPKLRQSGEPVEAAVHRCSTKQMLLKLSQKNTFNLQIYQKRAPAQMFFCIFFLKCLIMPFLQIICGRLFLTSHSKKFQTFFKYRISSNKRQASIKHRPLISAAPLDIHIEISAPL